MTIIIMSTVTGTMATTAEAPTVSHFDYVREPAAIYRRSRKIALAETDLGAVADDMREVALRLVHACGEPSVVADLRASLGAGTAGGAALANRAAILCDTEMVAHGVIRAALPQGMTRSAAAVDLWDDDLDGAIVAIGNAPTALYRLLERLEDDAPRPALIIAMPVGFVGAAESKQALIDGGYGVPYMALTGRRGGSALAAAAVNALASPLAGGNLS